MKSIKCSVVLWYLLSTVLNSLSGQTLSPLQTDCLFKSGQLWGHLTYFHPYLQYKKISFDSAYAAAVPKIIAAQTDSAFVDALNEWLSVLNDPVTHARINQPTATVLPFEATYEKKGNIGLLTFSGSLNDWNTAFEKITAIMDSISDDEALIIDCQDLKDMDSNLWLIEATGFQSQLFKGSISTAGSRSVCHDGFVPETGSTSGGYETYFKSRMPQALTGIAAHDRVIVFITASTAGVLPVIASMQKAGKAVIISKDVLVDNSNTVTYDMTEGVKISFRLYESLSGNIEADYINADKTALLNKAVQIIAENDFKPHADRNDKALLITTTLDKNPYYTKESYPNLGYRVLAAVKIYAVINYFFPNKKFMTQDWDALTKNHLNAFINAKDSIDYQLAVLALYAHIEDGHGFIRGASLSKLKMGGSESTIIQGKLVEDKYIVTQINDDSLARDRGIEKGDIILKRDGRRILDILNELKQYVAYSNDVTGMHYTSRVIYRGANDSEAIFTIQKKNGIIKEIKLPFNTKYTLASQRRERDDLEILRFLSPHIGYADLDRLEPSAVDSMFELFKDTKAIVFDMRGYPQATAWTIAPRLTAKKNVNAAKFTRLDLDYPKIVSENSDIAGGSETWTSFIQNLPAASADKKTYTGKTVMLMNESTQSQAEHTGLFLYAANNTQFIGSQTAGANGDVTNFTIPGNLTLYFSGQTVWFPDGKQLQRTGLEPHILVRPTIKGIQDGKDEVLERAIKYIETGL